MLNRIRELYKKIRLKAIPFLSYNLDDIYIKKGSRIGSPFHIGRHTRVNGKITLKGQGTVIIGRFCAIGDDVKIITQNHMTKPLMMNLNLQKKLYSKVFITVKGVVINDNVWVGDNVIILPGVEIGHGSVIAAGSIVTKDVKPLTIVAGVPAKFIRSRDVDIPSQGSWGKFYDDLENKLK